MPCNINIFFGDKGAVVAFIAKTAWGLLSTSTRVIKVKISLNRCFKWHPYKLVEVGGRGNYREYRFFTRDKP
jgi:hypothetical protein